MCNSPHLGGIVRRQSIESLALSETGAAEHFRMFRQSVSILLNEGSSDFARKFTVIAFSAQGLHERLGQVRDWIGRYSDGAIGWIARILRTECFSAQGYLSVIERHVIPLNWSS